MLDASNQADAAAIKLGVRTLTDDQWTRLEAERETAPDDPQLELEDLAGPVAAKPKRRTRSVRQMKRKR